MKCLCGIEPNDLFPYPLAGGSPGEFGKNLDLELSTVGTTLAIVFVLLLLSLLLFV